MIRLQINYKVHMVCNVTFNVKSEGVLKVQAVTFTSKVVVSQKWS